MSFLMRKMESSLVNSDDKEMYGLRFSYHKGETSVVPVDERLRFFILVWVFPTETMRYAYQGRCDGVVEGRRETQAVG